MNADTWDFGHVMAMQRNVTLLLMTDAQVVKKNIVAATVRSYLVIVKLMISYMALCPVVAVCRKELADSGINIIKHVGNIWQGIPHGTRTVTSHTNLY